MDIKWNSKSMRFRLSQLEWKDLLSGSEVLESIKALEQIWYYKVKIVQEPKSSMQYTDNEWCLLIAKIDLESIDMDLTGNVFALSDSAQGTDFKFCLEIDLFDGKKREKRENIK
jgi:hypothetical protein